MIKLVHCMREPYDIYIGRGLCPLTQKQGIWGNPYAINKLYTREMVIQKYEVYLRGNEYLLSQIYTLKDKILGCWCFPRLCHGSVLIKIYKEMYENNN